MKPFFSRRWVAPSGNRYRHWGLRLKTFGISLVIVTGLASCVHKPVVPPEAPEAQKVLVPVLEKCEPVQVAPSTLATEAEELAGDIFRDVQLILADREALLGDRKALLAANEDPCP